jgi:trehalose 6-phosphate phosphatase
MPHLLNVWPTVSRLLSEAHQVLLALDYDGTLSPIVDRPELALLPTETKKSLICLNRKEKYLVGVISTRGLADIRDRVGIDGLIYAGNRGLEISGKGMDFIHPEALRLKESVNQAFRRLQQDLERFNGVTVEHKGLSLTVHYRLAPDGSVGEVKEVVDAATSSFVESGTLTLSTGKMAIEILPNVNWGKGDAIHEIREALTQCSLPVYFGDDLVDEDGFAAVQAAGGFGVFVGPAGVATDALYRVDSPQEVAETLRLMAQI